MEFFRQTCHTHAMSSQLPLTPILRGLARKCPACGEGGLFSGYLKLNATCSECGAEWDHEKAADGPAWLTVLVLGPLFVAIIFAVAMTTSLPPWIALPPLMLLMFGIALTLLAFLKGAWLGMLYHMEKTRGEQ